jgi:single-stranded-DNA-specific exonuclease
MNKLKTKSKMLKIEEVINSLLENRGIKTKKEKEEFLNPKLEKVTVGSVGIDKRQLIKAVKRIENAIKEKEKIVVFGDYDVDGISGTAILWESLNALGADVMPYIPDRVDEGYGLSERGMSNVKCQMSNVKLVVTVDNGIVANEAVDFANEEKIDVIITDHHVMPSKKKDLPKAHSIVHTTKLCGAGVAWLLSSVILNSFQDLPHPNPLPRREREWERVNEIPKPLRQTQSPEFTEGQVQHDTSSNDHLGLVALATVADLVPLTGANRTLLKFGLQKLRKTNRVGLLELFKEAGLDNESIGVYEIGHIIAPRLNAMGRLQSAMDSLRLICTRNRKRAEDLAGVLGQTNRERQVLTAATFENSKLKTQSSKLQLKTKKLLFTADESYEQGIIGLVAGKLVEEYYRPAIVVSKGDRISKGSARSISGFNIIEFIRAHSSFLINAGGHPMAAGFTIETSKIAIFQKALEEKIESALDKDLLTRKIKIDIEILVETVDYDLYRALQQLAPFGMGNREPMFLSKGIMVEGIRTVGAEGKHLKLELRAQSSEPRAVVEGIGFGLGEMATKIKTGDRVDIVYSISENEWNGDKKLQLKIKSLDKN